MSNAKQNANGEQEGEAVSNPTRINHVPSRCLRDVVSNCQEQEGLGGLGCSRNRRKIYRRSVAAVASATDARECKRKGLVLGASKDEWKNSLRRRCQV